MRSENTIITNGKKKSAIARATVSKTGTFSITINNVPYERVTDKLMISKIKEIISVVEYKNINDLSFEISTNEKGTTSNIFAARQAFAKGIVAYFGKYCDEFRKMEIKNKLLAFDKYTLVTDSRRREPKKFGGPGARARYQKSYR